MGHEPFPTTRWSLIDRFGQTGVESPLEEFLRRYRPAMLAFLETRLGADGIDPEDIVQGFIADKILRDSLLQEADAGRGRLRNLLVRSLRNYALNARRSNNTGRRAPAQRVISLNEVGPETVGGTEARSRFEVEWARAILDQALARTYDECFEKDLPDCWWVFLERVVNPLLQGSRCPTYVALVAKYGFKSPAEASNRLTTAKRMFARNLRAIISEYVTSPAEVEEELHDLQNALSRAGRAGFAN